MYSGQERTPHFIKNKIMNPFKWLFNCLLRNLYSEKLNAKLFTLLNKVSETIRKIKDYNNKMTLYWHQGNAL